MMKSDEDFLELRRMNNLLKSEVEQLRQELKQSHGHHRNEPDYVDSLFEASPVAMLILNSDTNIVRTNSAALRLTGGTGRESPNHRPGDLLGCIHSSADPRGCGYSGSCPLCPVRNSIESLLDKGGSLQGAEVALTVISDGEPKKIWLETSAETLYLNNERHLCVSMNDVTLRKVAEEKLVLSESVFRETFDHSPVGSVMVGMDKRFIKCNSTFTEFLGYHDSELVGKLISSVTHPDDIEIGVPEMKRMLMGEISKSMAEKRYIRKDGAVVWGRLSISMIRDDRQAPLFFLAIIKDITEFRRATDELLKKDELLNITGSTARVGGWEFNAETLHQTWTDEVYRIHELDKSFDPDVNSGVSFYAPSSRQIIRNAIANALEHGDSFDLELEFMTKNGNKKWVRSIGKALRQNGKTVKVYGSIQDITDRKEAEEQIRRQNEELRNLNATKDKFFSIIAHDLRNPFNSFLGLTQLMAEDITSFSTKEIKEIAVRMSNSAANLYRLLENLLQWARVQQGTITIHREPVNLLAVVQESLSLVSEHSVSKGISITCEVPEHLTMQADLQMLQTIIRNLVSNAIKFTPAGGSVHITAGGNGMIELAVRDTGIGMSAEMVANLFRIDTPTTRKGTGNETGTGLGLLLCQELAEKLNGKITVESREKEGSCFRLTLQRGEP